MANVGRLFDGDAMNDFFSGLKLRAVNAPWWGGVQFLICETRNGRVSAVAKNVELHTIDEGADVASEPTFMLSNESTQILMDELWRCGFRPSDGTGSAGQLAATEKHLEDMRRLVFNSVTRPTLHEPDRGY